MRAIELQNAHGLDNLVLTNRRVLQPGPGQVLVRMTAASLNFRDLATVTIGPASLPLVPCSDGCGHICVIGVLSGHTQELSIPEMFRSNARIQGVTVGSRDHFEDMCRAIAINRIHPVVDRTFPLEQTREAFQLMQAGGHFGKIVIDI